MDDFQHIPVQRLSKLEMKKMILELQMKNAALEEALRNCAISASGQNWQQIAWIVESALYKKKQS